MTALVPVPVHAPAAPSMSFLWGGWEWTGSFTTLDLLAAATGAFSGAVLVRHPRHFRDFTVVGVLLLAAVAGVGGGIVRDVLVDHLPSALTNPAYLTVAVVGGVIGFWSGADTVRGRGRGSSGSPPRSRCPSTRSSARRRASRSVSPPSVSSRWQ